MSIRPPLLPPCGMPGGTLALHSRAASSFSPGKDHIHNNNKRTKSLLLPALKHGSMEQWNEHSSPLAPTLWYARGTLARQNRAASSFSPGISRRSSSTSLCPPLGPGIPPAYPSASPLGPGIPPVYPLGPGIPWAYAPTPPLSPGIPRVYPWAPRFARDSAACAAGDVSGECSGASNAGRCCAPASLRWDSKRFAREPWAPVTASREGGGG